MDVSLLQATPLQLLMTAIRTSHASIDKLDTFENAIGPNDAKLLEKIIQLGHDSVLEHLVYTFQISGISRALLQQLARHRHVSMTVQSTRYTLKKLLEYLRRKDPVVKDVIESYCVTPPYEDQEALDEFYRNTAYQLKLIARSELSNDVVKSFLPECFKTELVLTTNARELNHILKLRLDKKAYWEFRQLAKELFCKVYKKHPAIWYLLAEREGYKSEVLECMA